MSLRLGIDGQSRLHGERLTLAGKLASDRFGRANMNCREFDRCLADYLERHLSGELRDAFERHAGACAECLAYVDTYRETIRLVREAITDPNAALGDNIPAETTIEMIATARQRPPARSGPERDI